MVPHTDDTAGELVRRSEELLAAHPPATTRPLGFLRSRFDAGLAWVHYPEGLGGLGLDTEYQAIVDDALRAAGAPEPDDDLRRTIIGMGLAAPTIMAFGTDGQKRRFLRPLWTGEESWCQLFSEPGAGSDLAGLATRAVPDGPTWIVNGQKVWTTEAHVADWGLLLARTDPDVPKHAGLTYFLCDMSDPGVEVRPLRQLTGEAEFNEVFLADVRIPDEHRVGEVGQGWKVANGTLANERIAIGGQVLPRESGMIGVVAETWRSLPDAQRSPILHDQLTALWAEAEIARLTAERSRQRHEQGEPGPESSAIKLTFAGISQRLAGLEVEMSGEAGLRYSDWTMCRPDGIDLFARDAGYRYLRARGNSIEGGTSEILRNIIAERILGLPPEPRVDKDIAWKDVPR